MRRLRGWWLVPSMALAAACAEADRRSAEPPGASAAASDTTAPMGIVTVLYHTPRDTAAFEKYYQAKHLPLLSANQKDIGFVRVDLTRFTSDLEGSKPAFYRQTELYFPSLEYARKGTATSTFKRVAEDFSNFASGGLTALVGVATSEPGPEAGGAPAAIVTVIYETPEDTAAFEQYFEETHAPLIEANQPDIGFRNVEFTRFQSHLDGSRPKFHRQAEFYFPSRRALEQGIATPAFKKVAGDQASFASGGFTGLIAVETP